MTIEVRHLLFDEEEVKAAVLTYQQRRAPHSIMGVPGAIRIDSRPSIAVTLEISSPREGRVERLRWTTTEVAAALILFCREGRIPLPAQSLKRLGTVGSQLCLSVYIGVGKRQISDMEAALAKSTLFPSAA